MSSSAQERRYPEILVVDENPSGAYLLQGLLERCGIGPVRVKHAHDLAEADQWLEDNHPGAIVLDLDPWNSAVPKCSSAIWSGTACIPTIIVSDHDDLQIQSEARRAGALDFIVKDDRLAERLTQSLRSALAGSFRRIDAEPRSHAAMEGCHDDRRERGEPDSIDSVLDDVLRAVHARFSSAAHIVVDKQGHPLFAVNPVAAREVLDHLLLGMIAACEELHAGRLELHIRTSGTSACVLVSLEVRPDERIDEYRSRVLSLLVGRHDDSLLDHHLEYASVAIGKAGGSARCRPGDDGRLWIQISLPRGRASERPPRTRPSLISGVSQSSAHPLDSTTRDHRSGPHPSASPVGATEP